MDYANMSLWKKIQLVKQKLLESNLIQTGENKYAGFKYYELGDFIPTIIKVCNEVGLFTKVTFTNEVATLRIVNCDKQDQFEEYTSPMRELELKGCNQIQALGGVETYSRRYLYMSAFDITENDMFGPTTGDKSKNNNQDSNGNTKKVITATDIQIKFLEQRYKGDSLTKLLDNYKVGSIKDLPITVASQLIKAIKEKEGKEE